MNAHQKQALTSDRGHNFPCPTCSGPTCVFNVKDFGDRIWRRRACKKCAHRFTTTETIKTPPARYQRKHERPLDFQI